MGTPTLEDLTDPEKAKVYWDGLKALADASENVYIKLSMLCYTDKAWDEKKVVTDAVHKVISIFGEDRCFFCSNYPPDLQDGWSADKLFKAFD